MNTPSECPSARGFRGVFAALVTPMHADEEVDYARLASFMDQLVRAEIHGLIPLASMGEYHALTGEEREQVLRTTLEAAAGRVRAASNTAPPTSHRPRQRRYLPCLPRTPRPPTS